MLRRQHRFFRSVLIAADTVIISAAAVLAFYVRFDGLDGIAPPPAGEVISYSTHAIPLPTTVPIVLLAMMWAGLYRPRRDQRFHREAVDIFRAVVVGVVVTFATIGFLSRVVYDALDPSRLQYVVYGGLTAAMLLAWRGGFRSVLRMIRRRGWNLRHVAIVGTGRLGHPCALR